MVSLAGKARPRRPVPRWHRGFLALLPRICYYARFAFRGLDPESKQEAVQSVVCGALAAYVRLVELGKTNIAYPSAAPPAINQRNRGLSLEKSRKQACPQIAAAGRLWNIPRCTVQSFSSSAMPKRIAR